MRLAFALTMNRVTDEAKAGNETGAMSSMLKYYGTELNKRRRKIFPRETGGGAGEGVVVAGFCGSAAMRA